MSDNETALAVAAAIAALHNDDEMTQAVENGGEDTAGTGTAMETEEKKDGEGKVEEPVAPPPPPPKPKTKVMSCLICTKAITPENTQMGSSNPSSEYERMMRVLCKLLCVDSHPMLKRWQFRHSEEPKKLCCDECCEVVFNLGSLQSIIDRTKLAINKKLDWILKTVADTSAEESDDIEKVFFTARSDVFRSEVLEVCKKKKNAKNGLDDDSDDEEELVNKGVQTDVSGESGVTEKTTSTKAGLKFFDERPSFSFDDHNMDTYSDHNDDMNFTNSFDNDDSNFSFSNKSDKEKKPAAKKTPAASSSSQSKPPTRRGRPPSNKRVLKFDDDEDDDDIEVLEEKRAPPKPKPRTSQAKASKIDARELLKVEYNEGGRPKRTAAAKRPNYQALAGDDDDYIPSVKRSSTSSITSSGKKSAPRKEVTLSAIPIVKDASGKTYFEGVEIVRTDKSITCKHLGCYYVVDGSGYNAFERIKAHIHDTHIGDGALADIY